MTKIELEIHDDILSALEKIKNVDDHGIELIIPEGSVLFDNIINLKLLEKEAEKVEKTLHFSTTDKYGLNIIAELTSEDSPEDLTAKEFAMDESHHEESRSRREPKFHGQNAFASITNRLKTRKSKLFKLLLIMAIILGLGTYGAVYALQTVPKANVKVIVNSQPLTKSVQIKVIKDGSSNADSKILKGHQVDTVVSITEVTPATGERLIGENAEGKIRIFNKTITEKEFKKGHLVRIEEDDEELEYKLKETVTVPAGTEDPDTHVFTPGIANANVTATDIGEVYNIEDGKDLEVDDEDTSDFIAESDKDFSGGKSEKILVVTEADKTLLINNALKKSQENIESNLEAKNSTSRKYIKGSFSSKVVKEEFSHEIDEEATELELKQELLITGLAYSENELDQLLSKLVEGLIPDGYTLSSQDKEIKVEVLGNTETTVASTDEADIQVTIKAFVITIIEQDDLTAQMVGKPIEEAQKILGGIKNIQTYELNVSPSIPFLQKMPTNPENINLTIEKQ